MNINALVIDKKTIGILDSACFENEWFENFLIPSNNDGIRRVQIEDIVYLLSEEADESSGYLVINMSIFNDQDKFNPRLAFERIIRVVLRHFDRSVSIPIQWQPYHVGCLLSIYAQPQRNADHRIYFNQSPDGSENIYAFAITKNTQEFNTVPEDRDLYHRATNDNLINAIIDERRTKTPSVGNFGVLLSEPLGVKFAGTGTLKEWYEHRLNKEQKSFVDQINNRPIRLRGSAGTGKTQSMVIKCLRDLYSDQTGRKTFAFITHSSALAHEVVRGMMQALDPTEQWTTIKTPDGNPRLWIGTIYELAQEKLGYDKKGLTPLSLDGCDGKEYQRILIIQAINNIIHNPRLVLGTLKDCPDFHERLKNIINEPKIIDEIMNEFACVLDLENIRNGTDESERYVRGQRESWQMELPSESHRRTILEIHSQYRVLLRNEKMLSMDQMIADFARYLETHEWEQLKDRDGFDVVFVDEYHYLTRAEAMTLHNLFKSDAQTEGRWPLIMAYDIKQSTNDTPITGGMSRFKNPNVGESVLTELKQVYRSTQQISNFLRDLDASFPAMDLEGEFSTYSCEPQSCDGEIPTLALFEKDISLVDSIFEQAVKTARNFEDGGRQVAVLCLNNELFNAIREAGRVKNKIVTITTREDFKELRYAKKKCIFSMPEYVAGLQFDTVYLIHANQSDYDDSLGQGARRRYISRVYLGASRAKNKIHISSSSEHGGISSLFESLIKNGTLKYNE